MSILVAGRFFGLGAALIWGTSSVATAVALRGFSPFGVAAFRGIGTTLAMVVLLAALWLVGRRSIGVRQSPTPWSLGRATRLVILGLLSGFAYVVGLTIAVELTGAAITGFLAGMYPIMAAAAAPFILGERLTAGAIAGMGLATVGVLLLSGADATGVSPLGVLMGLVASASGAAFLLLGRRWSTSWGLSPVTISLANFVLLALGGTVVAAARGSFYAATGPDPQSFFALIWLCVGAGVLANIFVISSIRRISTQESAAYLLITPVFAAALAFVLLGETLDIVQLLGGALVLLGIVLAAVLPSSGRRVAAS